MFNRFLAFFGGYSEQKVTLCISWVLATFVNACLRDGLPLGCFHLQFLKVIDDSNIYCVKMKRMLLFVKFVTML